MKMIWWTIWRLQSKMNEKLANAPGRWFRFSVAAEGVLFGCILCIKGAASVAATESVLFWKVLLGLGGSRTQIRETVHFTPLARVTSEWNVWFAAIRVVAIHITTTTTRHFGSTLLVSTKHILHWFCQGRFFQMPLNITPKQFINTIHPKPLRSCNTLSRTRRMT